MESMNGSLTTSAPSRPNVGIFNLTINFLNTKYSKTAVTIKIIGIKY